MPPAGSLGCIKGNGECGLLGGDLEGQKRRKKDCKKSHFYRYFWLEIRLCADSWSLAFLLHPCFGEEFFGSCC